MGNVESLKVLFEALGGDPTTVANISTIPEMIVALADVVGHTIELPKVTAANNGEVLTVVNGQWDKDVIPIELPLVTASDVGCVLKVNAEGKWAKGTI